MRLAMALAILVLASPVLAAEGVAPVASTLRGRFDAVAAMPASEERTLAVDVLGNEPSDQIAALLADTDADHGPLPPGLQLAVEVFVGQKTFARRAALALLEQRNDIAIPFWRALAGLWDGEGEVERALDDRLWMPYRDREHVLWLLANQGTRRSMPAVANVLFFSEEKDNLTWFAQLAATGIAKRDKNPAEAMSPILKDLNPGWPEARKERVRFRDVVLAVSAARDARALAYVEQSFEPLDLEDVESVGPLLKALCRIGTRDALRSFTTRAGAPYTGELAYLEPRRQQLLAEALADCECSREDVPVLMPLALRAQGSKDEAVRAKVHAAFERLLGEKLPDLPAVVRKLMRVEQEALDAKHREDPPVEPEPAAPAPEPEKSE